MDAKETLSKLAGNEAVKELLGADGLTGLTALVATAADSEKKFKDSEAKAARILSEKKEVQDKFVTLEGEIASLKESGLSDADKVKAENQKVLTRAETAEAALVTMKADFSKSQRTVAMDKIAGGVKFIDAITPEAGRTLLNSHLAGLEDLADESAVTTAIDAFKESNKGVIAADSQGSGAGTPQPVDGGGGGGGDPMKQSATEREASMKSSGLLD